LFYFIFFFILLIAREYPWVLIIIVGEEYASKTCGWCGTIKANLGGNKSCGRAARQDDVASRDAHSPVTSNDVRVSRDHLFS